MKKTEFSSAVVQMIYITLFSTLIFSCTSDENNVVGVWNLKQMEPICDEEQVMETSETNGDYCLDVTRTDSTGPTVLTTTSTTCLRLELNDMGSGTLMSSDGEEINSTEINYTVTENQLEVCDADNNCLNFEIDSDALILDLEIMTITGGQCNRVFTFRK
ncbi:MAG: hypothetical protein AAGA77_10735 [Bacteroidota bacterium]